VCGKSLFFVFVQSNQILLEKGLERGKTLFAKTGGFGNRQRIHPLHPLHATSPLPPSAGVHVALGKVQRRKKERLQVP
jgi:hypothetical protein